MSLTRPILAFIFMAISLLFLTRAAIAQEAYEDIPEATFAQDSPFYFLRGWQEGVESFIANFQSEEARTELELRFAQRRIAEMERLARLGKNDLLAKAEERWQSHLAKAQELSEKLTEKQDEVRERILEQMDRHRTVLEKVLAQVPEQAQDAINRAIENYTIRREEMLTKFESRRTEIEARLKQRLEKTIERSQLDRDRFLEILKNHTN